MVTPTPLQLGKPQTFINYVVYKNLGSRSEPDWSETPVLRGLTKHDNIADLLTDLGDIAVDFNVTHNEDKTLIANDIIVVEVSTTIIQPYGGHR